MRFQILSLFPDYFSSPLGSGLMGRGQDKGLVSCAVVNPRDFATDNHRSVDDRPYGGGPGMVMLLEPLVSALESLEHRGRILMLSPRGRPLDQAYARELAREQTLTLVCGRYEGIDARLSELYPIEEVSVGDFVLNGGETAALCVMESVSRLLPGFMGHEDSADEESHSQGLLEYPHYTRPPEYAGHGVPEVLSSGDHGRIRQWRRRESLRLTCARRPDMLSRAVLDQDDLAALKEIRNEQGMLRKGKNLFLALVHFPVVNSKGYPLASSLTNLDIHDIARVSRTNGCGGFFVTTPLRDQQQMVGKLLHHWTQGAGARKNPDRAEALRTVRVVDELQDAVREIEALCGKRPKVVATSARMEGSLHAEEVREWLDDEAVLLVFGTASGLAREVMDSADARMRPVRFMSDYNHLSVRAAVAIIVDRILGDVY